MGVGWWQYQYDPTWITTRYYRYILHPDIFHSVRDSYTEAKMVKMGFRNVINTGCPTAWNLTKEFCKTISTRKSDAVLFTLTEYKKDYFNDMKLIALLRKNYKQLYFWAQGFFDVEYINDLLSNTKHDIKFIGANLFQLKEFMKNTDFDCIGTRLHGGILSLNYRKKTMIIGVDNRANEMKKDINLPVVPRGDLKGLQSFIDGEYSTDISLKSENISFWRNQFVDTQDSK